jgi:hypothetical protein
MVLNSFLFLIERYGQEAVSFTLTPPRSDS